MGNVGQTKEKKSTDKIQNAKEPGETKANRIAPQTGERKKYEKMFNVPTHEQNANVENEKIFSPNQFSERYHEKLMYVDIVFELHAKPKCKKRKFVEPKSKIDR